MVFKKIYFCCATLTPFAAVYAIVVRSYEYDLPPEMLDDIISRSIPSFASGSGKAKYSRDVGSDEDDY